MSITAIWLFLKSKAGMLVAGALGLAALILRMRFLEHSRDSMKRKAEVAKSDAKVAAAEAKIGSAINRKRAEAAKDQQANNQKAKAKAKKTGRRRDIGGW